jgi:PhnB protein
LPGEAIPEEPAMSQTVSAIPEGQQAVTPYIVVADAARALEFYARVFGATERMRLAAPDGKIGHAEIEIGGSVIMIADEWPESPCRSPQAYGGSPVALHLYVPDVDKVVADAVAAGATVLDPVEDKFYGDRSGTLADPFGHVWYVLTHIEDVSADEMKRRAEAFMAQTTAG